MVLDRRCDERVGIVGTIPRSSSASAINAMILRRLIIEADRLSPTVAIPPILFSNSGSGFQAFHDHPCRAHCSLRGRGVPSA
jgi:hypothetical protein